MSATIRDVAKICGVSVSTVSRVLNGYTDISEETANKVYEAIRKLDYVPNNTARMLSKKNTRIIGLTIPDIKDPFFSENAAGAENLLLENGYQIFYGNMDRSGDKLLKFLQQARQMRFDGLIITPDAWTEELLDTLQKSGIPVVSLRRRPPQSSAQKTAPEQRRALRGQRSLQKRHGDDGVPDGAGAYKDRPYHAADVYRRDPA